MTNTSPEAIKDLLAAKIAGVFKAGKVNKWAPQLPTPRQKLFLSVNDQKEVFYGGAAGGGKSSCLLMAALEYVDVPGYSALLLRRTYADLSKPGALMDRAHQWLKDTPARWNEQKKQWTFPSGATLQFGYLESEVDKYTYQGAEYQFIGFDELTQFTETGYTYLFSRLRRLAGSDIPLRVRAASNPGGLGGRWVHERFIPEGFTPADAVTPQIFWKSTPDSYGDEVRRAFIPARLDDNPHLDREEYMQSLRELDPVTREQLMKGDWQISERGDIYPMWSEAQHVISWSQFKKVYGVANIPGHWQMGVFMDNGTTEGHPNVTSWFATAPANAPFAGSTFLYRGHCVYNQTTRQIAEYINEASKLEKDRIVIWRNGHDGNSERMSFGREFGLPFSSWKADRNRGIAQIRNYLEIQHKEEPHPFKPGVMGRPTMFLVVADDQLEYPKDDAGLARWREEFPVYHYKTMVGGGLSSQVVPHSLFNDAMDTVRAAGAEYFAPIVPLTMEEQIAAKMTQVYAGRTFQDILDMPPESRGPAIDAYRIKEHEVRQSHGNGVVKSGIVKWRRRGRH